MEKNTDIYVRLQRHLNRQAVGFPATKSGSEIRILKHLFTPRQAEVATCLRYRFEPIEAVFARANHFVESPEKLEELLDQIEKKGGVESTIKDGKRFFSIPPLVVGMYEYQVGRLTPEFIKDFDAYVSERKFGIEFLSTKLPQMRTIPIAKSIQPQHNVSTFDEVTRLLEQADAPFVVLECICRQKKALLGRPCRVTDRKESCLAVGNMARLALRNGIGREISLDASMAILAQNQKQGLVLQPSNTKKAEFVCSCCGCCCGMLGMHKHLPKPVDFWASNFFASVDTGTCDGCGVCEKRCQVRAASVSAHNRQAVIDRNRCIGCGVCVPTCPNHSISLKKKPHEVVPPQTREDLLDTIMAHKKGTWGKWKLTGKLVVDAIRTGHTLLLKR